MKKSMSIRTELGLKFGAVVLILLLMGFVMLFTFKSKVVKIKSTSRKVDLALTASALRGNYDEMIMALKTMIIQNSNQKIFNTQLKKFKKKRYQVKKYKKLVERQLAPIANGFSKETLQYLQDFTNQYKTFSKALDKAVPLLKAGDAKGAVNILRGQGLTANIPLAKFAKLVKSVADSERNDTMHAVPKMIKYGIYVLIIISIFAIISVLTFMKRICNMVNDIKLLTNAADTISMGKEYPPLKAKSQNELGKLTEAFERMRVSMQKAMSKLKK